MSISKKENVFDGFETNKERAVVFILTGMTELNSRFSNIKECSEKEKVYRVERELQGLLEKINAVEGDIDEEQYTFFVLKVDGLLRFLE